MQPVHSEGLSLPRKNGQIKPSIHLSLSCLLGGYILKHIFSVMTSQCWAERSPMKWRQHPGMTIAVDWTAKQKNKLTSKPGTVIDLIDKFCFEAAVRPMHSNHKFTVDFETLVHVIRGHVPLSGVLNFVIRANWVSHYRNFD